MRPSRTPSQTQQPTPHPIPPPYGQVRDKLDISPVNQQTRDELLRHAIFPSWRDDAASADLGQPDEMAEKDPIGIQMWKLYSRTKTQLPNQERMDNLTWRMMAMNLRRKEREQARFVPLLLAPGDPVRGPWSDMKRFLPGASSPPESLPASQGFGSPTMPPLLTPVLMP